MNIYNAVNEYLQCGEWIFYNVINSQTTGDLLEW